MRVDSDASMFSEEDQYLTGTGPRGATTSNQRLYCNGTYYPCTSQDNFDLADVSDNNSFDSAYEADETASNFGYAIIYRSESEMAVTSCLRTLRTTSRSCRNRSSTGTASARLACSEQVFQQTER